MPQMRSSSAPNIHNASMLNRMWNTPGVQEHVGDELPHAQPRHHPHRHQAELDPAAAGTNVVARNIATLAPMMILSAVEIGPGPNENEDWDA